MSDNTKVFSTRQEKMVAKELGGYPVGGSGAMPTSPGDVKTYDWLVECKTHTEPGHSILFNLAVWKKIQNEALPMHRKPVLIVDDGSQLAANNWCLCRAANLDLSKTVLLDWPVQVKKNISCSLSKLSDAFRIGMKPYLGTFYDTAVYQINWANDKVVIMPLKIFKELMNK